MARRAELARRVVSVSQVLAPLVSGVERMARWRRAWGMQPGQREVVGARQASWLRVWSMFRPQDWP